MPVAPVSSCCSWWTLVDLGPAGPGGPWFLFYYLYYLFYHLIKLNMFTEFY